MRSAANQHSIKFNAFFQVSAVLILIFGGWMWISWTDSLPTAEAEKRYPGKVVPTWRAVTINHGAVSEWRLGTPAQNPVGFSVCSVAVLSAVIYLFIFGNIDRASSKRKDTNRSKRH